MDWSVRRLPDVLTLPLAAGMAALLGVAALIPGAAGVWPRSLLGGLALGGGYLALHLLHSAGLGFGDVKLAAALGCALGWYGWWPLLLGTLAGSPAGLGLQLVAAGEGRAGGGDAPGAIHDRRGLARHPSGCMDGGVIFAEPGPAGSACGPVWPRQADPRQADDDVPATFPEEMAGRLPAVR
ncbi:hypothetical protein GCM10020000_29410 [Streptomyces olivoverticillatus]